MNWCLPSIACPGLFYGTPAQDGVLIRIRVPGGSLTRPQLEAIAHFSDQWSDGTVQVTNRANLQLRAIQAPPTVEVFQTLQSLGLAASDPSVDHLRNIMASPTAGIDPLELVDPRPTIAAIDRYLQTHPDLADLPAKFSIGIDSGGTVGIGTRSPVAWEHRYNEIQLSAVQPDSFQLALGANKTLHQTNVLIPIENCVAIVAALIRSYQAYVRTTRKKPRMRDLLSDWGIETYLEHVERQLNVKLQRSSIQSPPAEPYAHLGIHGQRQTDRSYLGLALPLGRISATQLRELAQRSPEIRLTPWQSVLIPDIPNHDLAELVQHLAQINLSPVVAQPWSALVACAGAGCAASATDTQAHAIALAAHLSRVPLTRPINIHFTGCPKSCAQPSPAELVLTGTTIASHEGTIAAYYINDHQDPIPISDLPQVVETLINSNFLNCDS